MHYLNHRQLLVLTVALVVASVAAGPSLPVPAGLALAAGSVMERSSPYNALTTSPFGVPAPTPRPVHPRRFDLVLTGATVIDGRGGPPLRNAVVALRGGRIAAVGRAGDIAVAAGTPIRNLRGKTILPGFVNAHVHIHRLPAGALRAWTRAGMTTLRDLRGPRHEILARRRVLAAANDPHMPRLLATGPMVTVAGGHPIPVDGLNDEALVVRGPDDARAKANALIDEGADMIKIVVSGRADVRWPELSNAEIRAITEAAHARGVRVTAHVDRAVALRRAVENGIDDAAHMPRDRMPDSLIDLMVKRKVALVPTIDVYEGLSEEHHRMDAWNKWTLPAMYDNLRRFAAAGGTLAFGDDYGGHPSMPMGMPMTEIQHWLAAGLTPMQVIVAATKGGAIVCDLQHEIGQLRPGMAADILVVDGNPLADIRALQRVAMVVHDGRIVVGR